MGYQNRALTGGYNFTLSTFEKVDGSTPKLGDIKCNEAVTWSGTDIQILDENGAVAKIDVEGLGEVEAIFWYVPAELADESMPEGWYLYDEDSMPITDYPQNGRELPFGQGFLMNCFDGDAEITYSGAVRNSELPKELDGGYNFVGNCSPVELTLGDFTCNEAVTWSGTDIQLLDDKGAVQKIEVDGLGEVDAIFWYVPAELADESMPEGWYLYDEDSMPITDYPQNGRKIPAAQGFLMNCFDGGAVVTIPSALPTPVKE